MTAVKRFWSRSVGCAKRDLVLCAAAALAAASMWFAPLSKLYAAYLDFRVLAILFCLMVIVAGLQQTGLFEVLAQQLARRCGDARTLELALAAGCFFAAPLVTNDVALLMFVPFAVDVLDRAGRRARLPFVVVMQTAAANLGSMLTPVGNPQNLYLYSFFQIGGGEFLSITWPIAGAGFLLIALLMLPSGKDRIDVQFQRPAAVRAKRRAAVWGVLFLLCLAAVARALAYQAVFAVVLAAALRLDWRLLKKVDYGLLATFVCFFILAGNLGSLPAVREFMARLVAGRELLTTVLLSQVISNVPAAVLLSPFTDDYRSLIVGANIGGLGTAVASLASLISFKIYLHTQTARPFYYLRIFTGVNLFLLTALIFTQWLLARIW